MTETRVRPLSHLEHLSAENGARFAWYYPRDEGEPSSVEVHLVDVRAADPVRVRYDFDRDGWIVEQPVWVCDDGNEIYDEWREVAFAPAWQFHPRDGASK